MPEAYLALQAAARGAPKQAPYWAALCAIGMRLGHAEQAIAAAKQALALNPNDVQTWVNLGELLLQRLDYAAAAQALEKALTLDPKGEQPASMRARALVLRTSKQLNGGA